MIRILGFLILCGLLAGCYQGPDIASQIVKVTDFELSPDEDKVAFSAITPIGNSDIWVVNIDGTDLKKLTFKDRSLSNHIARFFKNHKWRNFCRIDMHSPEWTRDGRITFCEEITRHHATGIYTKGLIYWTIKPDGEDKRPKNNTDDIVRRNPLSPIHNFELSDLSEKHNKKIFLKDDILWVLGEGETTPKSLIQP
ncbi:MAG: hypothetical protein KKD90_02160 [Candidatus Omnitrophica bacterium]|nr:hypothetical protein [Candidatus Omnitrophota bacterium]